jgi:hypothetical protein
MSAPVQRGSITDFALLISDTSAARAYLQLLTRRGLVPRSILFVDIPVRSRHPNPLIRLYWKLPEKLQLLPYYWYRNSLVTPLEFDPLEPIAETFRRHSVAHTTLREETVNSPSVLEWVRKRTEPFVIYGAGGLVKKPLLEAGKPFLHIHPGVLPDVRGGDGLLWSILTRGRCGATCFFLDAGIDTGNIIRTKEWDAPVLKSPPVASILPRFHLMMMRRLLERSYDAQIRADLLLEVLDGYFATGDLNTRAQDTRAGETYFMMHPLLASLALSRDPA